MVSFRTAASGEDRAGILRPDNSVVVPAAFEQYSGLMSVMRNWEQLLPEIELIDPADLVAVPDAYQVAPLRYPNKLIMAGANYVDHLAEMGDDTIPEGIEPFFFMVPPSTTLIGHDQHIEMPGDANLKVDWEAELAVVIGRGGSDISASNALDHIAGYSCFNDVTARGALRRPIALAPPFQWDWARAKGLDTFCPMGPITPVWQIADSSNLSVKCTVNDVVKQDGTTSSLIFTVAELIAAASRSWRLEPGDVIATGTPAGVGAARGEQLADGDVVVVEITGMSPLRNTVRQIVPAMLSA